MYIKFLRDDQRIFTLGGSIKDDAAWGITEITGTDTIENSITTAEMAIGDGIEITGEKITHRNIDIMASVKKRQNNAIERQMALTFFNPKHNFTMYVTNTGETRWIKAKLERFQCQSAPTDRHASMSIALLCADPYFYSVDDFGKNIAAVTGCFAFPFMSALQGGFKVGVYNFAKKININNAGDAETYAKIVIEAEDEVENPKIMINDAYIRLLETLQNGDVVEIDLIQNTIKKNGANCIGKTDRQSTFSGMKLQVGDNEVSFTADNGDTKMRVMLYYNLRYMGV